MISVAITFISLPEPDDYIRIKVRSKTSPFDIITLGETFKDVRVFAGECGIMTTVNDQAMAYAQAFWTDYPELLVMNPDSNEVNISLGHISPYSEITEVEISGAFTESIEMDQRKNTIHIIRFTPRKYNDLPVLGRYLIAEGGQLVLTETDKKIKL